MTTKLIKRFDSKRESKISEPIFTAQIVKEGYLVLAFNRRHKRGTRQFLWLPHNIPAGVSELAKSKLEKLFALCKYESGWTIKFDHYLCYDNGESAGDCRWEHPSPLRYGDKIIIYENKIKFVNYHEPFPRPRYYRD